MTGAAVSPDGKLLAVSSGFHNHMGELAVWTLSDRTKRFTTRREFGIRAGRVFSGWPADCDGGLRPPRACTMPRRAS